MHIRIEQHEVPAVGNRESMLSSSVCDWVLLQRCLHQSRWWQPITNRVKWRGRLGSSAVHAIANVVLLEPSLALKILKRS